MGNLVSFFFYAKIVLWVALGVVALWVVPVVAVYAWFFRRVPRPDYELTAGEYCYERIKHKLPRKELYYRAGKSVLKGYYYGGAGSNDLIVLSHGFRSGADDFLPLICALRERGYNVFCYDATGTYDSRGRSLVGMCQALVDLDHTLRFLASEPPYKGQSVYLVGHSLGGYAALSALPLHPEVRACVALAPVRDGTKVMEETARLFVGKLAYAGSPLFSALQKLRFGKYTRYNSLDGINTSHVPILIVQGKQDEILGYGTVSLCACKQKIRNPHVEFLEIDGLCGSHSGLWHSEAAVRYKDEIDGRFARLCKHGKRPTRAQKVAYFCNVDNALYSQASTPVVEHIQKTFCLAKE